METSINPFENLRITKDSTAIAEEEVEQQPNAMVEDKIQVETVSLQDDSPTRAPSPLSYVEMTRKKSPVTSSSSEDETFERTVKRVGRKSHKETRAEEAKRQKMKGSQSTIEMSISRNTRNRLPKGGATPSSANK